MINNFSHSSLELLIMAEYKVGPLVGPKGITLKQYLWLSGATMLIFLIYGPYWNLMVSLTSIEGDNPNAMCPNFKDS